MRKRKNDPLKKNLPPLKKVEGRLPDIFDLLWDIKYAYELTDKQSKEVQRYLAENGYDVEEWLSLPDIPLCRGCGASDNLVYVDLSGYAICKDCDRT